MITPDSLTIINYDILHKLDTKILYDLVILDEAHLAKNRTAKRSRLCRSIKAKRMLLLTGTPVLNRPVELFHLLHLLCPDEWPMKSYGRYTVRYCNAHQGHWGWDVTGASHLEELCEKLKGLLIRRLKCDVLKDLPPKRRQIITLPIDGLTAELKEQMLQADREAAYIEETYANDVMTMSSKLSVLWDETAKLRHNVGLAKVGMAIELIENILAAKEKVIVFAHHRDVIVALQEGLKKFNPAVIHGGVNMVDRQRAVDGFQKSEKVRVFIGQIQAAGVGIDLTAASYVVFVEQDWTPGVMTQAEDRPHRIGQKESVLVQYLVLEHSLDARIVKSAYKKEQIVKRVLNSTPAERKENGMDEALKGLLERFVRAAESIANSLTMMRIPSLTVPPPGLPLAPPCCEAKTEAAQTEPAAELVKPMDREAIKAELRKRGVKFKEAARTETLEKLLKDGGNPPEDTGTVSGTDAAPPLEATKDMIKDALIKLSGMGQRDTALKIINEIGKAENISKIDPSLYGAVLKACQERMPKDA